MWIKNYSYHKIISDLVLLTTNQSTECRSIWDAFRHSIIFFYLVPSGYIDCIYHPKILLPNVFLNFSFMNYYMLSTFVFYYAFYMNSVVVWLLLESLKSQLWFFMHIIYNKMKLTLLSWYTRMLTPWTGAYYSQVQLQVLSFVTDNFLQ